MCLLNKMLQLVVNLSGDLSFFHQGFFVLLKVVPFIYPIIWFLFGEMNQERFKLCVDTSILTKNLLMVISFVSMTDLYQLKI